MLLEIQANRLLGQGADPERPAMAKRKLDIRPVGEIGLAAPGTFHLPVSRDPDRVGWMVRVQ